MHTHATVSNFQYDNHMKKITYSCIIITIIIIKNARI